MIRNPKHSPYILDPKKAKPHIKNPSIFEYVVDEDDDFNFEFEPEPGTITDPNDPNYIPLEITTTDPDTQQQIKIRNPEIN
jgi:hypothetical protein